MWLSKYARKELEEEKRRDKLVKKWGNRRSKFALMKDEMRECGALNKFLAPTKVLPK